MSEQQTPPSTPNKVQRAFKLLKNTFSPRSLQPPPRTQSRKRTNSQSVGHVIAIPGSPVRSPFKKQKTSTIASPKKQSTILSPPNTPSRSSPRIIRPTKSFTTSPKSTPSIESSSRALLAGSPKKLDFKQFVISPEKTLSTPPVTPIKSDVEAVIEQKDLTAKKLDLNAPVKEEVELVGETSEDEEEDQENLCVVPEFRKPPRSIYAEAKSLFQRGFSVRNTENLPQREIEARALKTFIKTNLINSQSSSLYISGPPGTGKTAQTNLTLSTMIDTSIHGVQTSSIDGVKYKIGYTSINCMIVSRTKNIFGDIYKNLTGKSTSTLQNSKTELLDLLTDDKKADMNIIVLDELDKLITSDQQVLFELFSWTIFQNAKIILIGISNSLDMIDRLLPRLKINGLNPNTLSFMPYTAEQIKAIIVTKLKTLNKDPQSTSIPIIHPAAIQLCSKKSSNNTGDLRKAFDICRNAIEMVEKEVRGVNAQGLINSNKQVQDMTEFDGETAPKVKINHIAKICASVFDNNQSTRLKNLNLQQKFIVCMLIKNEMELMGNMFITMNSLYEFYIKNLNVDKIIGVLKRGEFLDVVTALESIGIVKLIRSTKEYSQVKISSCISKKDLGLIVQGVSVLEKLMSTDNK